MAEYYFALTDINNAIERLIHACPTTFYNGLQAARNIFSKDLAADVAPVRHGRWGREENWETGYGAWVNVCSACGAITPVNVSRYKYCPNCGAKMGGEP